MTLVALPTLKPPVGRDSSGAGPVADAVAEETDSPPPSTLIWGIPFSLLTFEATIGEINKIIQKRVPRYFITANLHYAMLNSERAEMSILNQQAAFILADGMPIVWRSRLSPVPLPERIAGSDLIYAMAELAAGNGNRIFFLGGADGVAQKAANILAEKYPGLIIAGAEEPPFRELQPHEEAELAMRIRDTKPDILLVALGQPRGEQWIARWHRQMEVPVSVQLGGTFNFVTGQIRRSPRWVAAIGMEWAWRFYCEPRRLCLRYARNAAFLGRALLCDLLDCLRRN